MSFTQFVLLGAVAMYICVWQNGKLYGVDALKSLAVAITLTIAGVAGAKLMFAIETFGRWDGRSFYGALFLVPVALLPLAKILNTRYGILMDISAPAGCIMHFILKVKCRIDGCCAGKKFTLSNGETFQFPSQIVEGVVSLIIMVVLIIMIRKMRWKYEIYSWYMILYGSTRLILNCFRETTPWLGPLPNGTLWSIVAIIIGVISLIMTKKKNSKTITKLNSESGASISFALLLFLVCAILSAVILVAGTTAAGRMSGLAETDQRYYSVNSAAQLISDELDGKTVSVFSVASKTAEGQTTNTTYIYNGPMNKIDKLSGLTGLSSVNGTLNDMSVTSIREAALKAYFDKTASTTMDLDYATGEDSPVNVRATMNVDTSTGDTDFILSNKTTSNKKYSVMLKFSTDVRHNNPPLMKDYEISDPVEITWHVNRLVPEYDS